MTKQLLEFIAYAILFVCEFLSALAEEAASQTYDLLHIAFNYLDQLDPKADLFLFMVLSTILVLAVSKLLLESLVWISHLSCQVFNLAVDAIATAIRKGAKAMISDMIYAGEKTCAFLKKIQSKI